LRQCAEGRAIALPGAPCDAAASYAAAAAAALAHPVHAAPLKTEAVARVRSEAQLAAISTDMDFRLSNGSLMLLPEYGFKLQVLKELAFVSADEVRPWCRRRLVLCRA
jgi:hypothetical protein